MGRTLMRSHLLIVATLLGGALNAYSADHAVILNDQERAVLLEIINEAVKARGLDMAPNAVYLTNKIKSAGVVTEQKQVPTEEPPK